MKPLVVLLTGILPMVSGFHGEAAEDNSHLVLRLSDLLDLPGEDVVQDDDLLGASARNPPAGQKIGGDNDLYLCSADQEGSDIAQIDTIDLAPNPPQRGRDLVTSAVGELSEAVQEGSYVHLQVKLEGTKVVDKKYDLCRSLERVGQSCPYPPGSISISKEMHVDKNVPRGKFFARLRVASGADEQITCFTGFFVF